MGRSKTRNSWCVGGKVLDEGGIPEGGTPHTVRFKGGKDSLATLYVYTHLPTPFTLFLTLTVYLDVARSLTLLSSTRVPSHNHKLLLMLFSCSTLPPEGFPNIQRGGDGWDTLGGC